MTATRLSSPRRYLFGIGTLCYESPPAYPAPGSTAAAAGSPPTAMSAAAASGEPAPLAVQSSWGWLVRRWLVRHADMLVGVACFAAALQAPSAFGLVLAAGSLITALQHGFANHATATAATRRWGRSRAASTSGGSSMRGTQQPGPSRQSSLPAAGAVHARAGGSATEQARAFRAECAASDRSLGVLMDAITALLQVLVAAWLLAQYLLQVAWLRGLVLGASPPLLPWLLLWLGLPVAGDAPTQVPHLTLEAMLRLKALVLVATALRHKAQRWQRKLLPAVVAAAEAHWPCPLFWPPKHPPVHAAAAADDDDGDVLPGAEGASAQQHADVRAARDVVGDSLPWEDLEPVLRRAGQLVSPVKAAIIQVRAKLTCSSLSAAAQIDTHGCWAAQASGLACWTQLVFLLSQSAHRHSRRNGCFCQAAPCSDAAVLLCASCACSCCTKWAW